MKQIVVILFLAGGGLAVNGTPLTSFTANVDAFLKRHVADGLVDYADIVQNKAGVETLYHDMSTMNLAKASAAEKKAFYINAYNIVVIYSVAVNYPVASPMDVKGFFDVRKHLVAGESLTLNELENQKLRQVYNDGRIHFALVCAARSCPPLAAFAFMPEKIDNQLNERTRFALNDNNWIKIHSRQRRVVLSEIFKWYKEDFTSGDDNPVTWINQFRTDKIPTTYSVDFYEYDWSLNKRSG